MNYFDWLPLSAVAGAALGAWLLIAAVLKLIGPASLPSDLENAVPIWLRPPLFVPFARWILPVLEATIGLAAHVAPDSYAVRWSVLIVFGLFFLTIVRLAVTSAHFNCGCMGSHHTSSRRAALGRGIAGISTATIFVASPIAPPLSSSELVWLHCSVWSIIATAAVIRMAYHFSGDVQEETA